MTSEELVTVLVKKYLDNVQTQTGTRSPVLTTSFVFIYDQEDHRVGYAFFHGNLLVCHCEESEMTGNLDMLSATPSQTKDFFLSTFPKHFNPLCDS